MFRGVTDGAGVTGAERAAELAAPQPFEGYQLLYLKNVFEKIN